MATSARATAQKRFEQLQVEQANTVAALAKAEQAEQAERLQRKKAEHAAKVQDHLRWESQVSAARQREMRKRAEASRLRAEWSAYIGDLSRITQAWNRRDLMTLGKLLQDTTPKENEPDFRDWEWYFFKDQYDTSATIVEHEKLLENPVAWCRQTNQILLRDGVHAVLRNGLFDDSTKRFEVGFNYHSVRWSPSGQRIALGGPSGELAVLDPHTGKTLYQDQPFDEFSDLEVAKTQSKINALAWSPDEKRLAIGNDGGLISIMQLSDRSRRLIRKQTLEGGYERLCDSLDWHPSKPWLAASLRQGLRRVYHTETGEVVEDSQYGSNFGGMIRWNPSGTILAAIGSDKTILFEPPINSGRALGYQPGQVRSSGWMTINFWRSVPT